MIDKMGNYPIFDGPTTVYKLNGFSLQELLSEFWKKIQDCIEDVNIAMELMNWIKEVGLPKEVQEELQRMYDDGRLAEIINETIFAELNQDITDVNNRVTLLEEGMRATVEKIINRESINVKDYGAKGDGVTNDTNAIQTAINTAINEGKKLIINEGTYLISSIDINQSIEIEGKKAILKSIPNNPNNYIVKIANSGLAYTQMKNVTIDGNKENNTTQIDGIWLHHDTWIDSFLIMEDLKIYNCSNHGITITGASGTYSRSAVREIRLNRIYVTNCNGNGLNATSLTDSYISKSVFMLNGKHGIYLEVTGSIKIDGVKCYWNGNSGIGQVALNRIPSGAFLQTLDTSPIVGKKYYTRTGTGNWQSPYSFTLFTGSSFAGGTTYYEVTSDNYIAKYNGIHLNQCTLTMITNTEVQDNAGDGIYIFNSTQTQIIDVSCDNNGLIFDENYVVTKYSDINLIPYYYGIYMINSTYSNINANFNNFRYNTDGYTQRSSIMVNNSNNNNITINSRLQLVNIEIVNITVSQNNILVNGNQLKLDIDLSVLALKEGYSFINNAWNGSYMYVKNNVLYFKIVIEKTDFFPTSAVTLFTLPPGLRPKFTHNVIAFMSTTYADTNNGGVLTANFNPNGGFSLQQSNASMKILNIQGSIDLNL